ncbi:MAG: DUF1284 domain-containing protein, partial [Puniceicoccales bacterium]|nr:DUF1284 domain-containing protein [Puniceicoccales bacterium]
CPQRVENGCTDEQRILRLDRAFANRLDLRVGKLLSWKDMEKKQRRLTLSAFEKICASCQWISICRRELFCRHKGGVFKPSAKYPF